MYLEADIFHYTADPDPCAHDFCGLRALRCGPAPDPQVARICSSVTWLGSRRRAISRALDSSPVLYATCGRVCVER